MRIFILFVILISVFFAPSKSSACSCDIRESVAEEVEYNSAVFSGEVIEMVDEKKNKSIQSSNDPIMIQFKVAEVWKGSVPSEFTVHTERSSASCGYEFTLNEEYLVYTKETDGELQVSFCSRTAPLSAAQSDLNELGAGEQPIKIDKVVSENTVSKAFFVYILVSIAILLVIFICIRRKKA